MTDPKPIPVGQKERAVQKRVVALFQDRLGYTDLGSWHDRAENRAVEREMLTRFLSEVQGYDADLIKRALFQLEQAAGNQSASLRKVMSSKSRLEKIVQDIVMDFGTRDRLMSGRGNAILVSDSIYNACRYYELFQQTPLKGQCAIVTSYVPTPGDIKAEDSGEGLTERLRQHKIYTDMLGDKTTEEFEKAAKKQFIEEPGRMRMLIVVAKLLTGFDAPSATYLYLDKQLQDHGLFQAICRVNRLDGDDKEYGYIIDYKDLFKSLERSMTDYTSEAFDAYAKEDVEGLLTNRLDKAGQRLEDALETIRALCEPVEAQRDTPAFIRFFCGGDAADKDGLRAQPKIELSDFSQL